MNRTLAVLVVSSLVACSDPASEIGAPVESASKDAGPDAAPSGRVPDGGATPIPDAGTNPTDASTTDANGAPAIWHPKPGTSWQWQLSGTLDTSLQVAMYDIDLFVNAPSTIASLKSRGIAVICYVDAGSWEPGRPDSDAFPSAVIGKTMDGWPDEKWLDVRATSVRDLIAKRFDVAAQKGCDGVEPDNVDGYTNTTGFPLTAADQLAFNRFLADAAHARGLSVALKNDLDQVADLVDRFDFAVNEQCFQYSECDLLTPFIKAGKAVFEVEYGTSSLVSSVCPKASALDFDTLIKNLDLGPQRISGR
jgi:hypothetical protein